MGALREGAFLIKKYRKRERRNMSDFTIIDTQEKFDKAVEERIKQEKAAVEQKYSGYLSPETVQKNYEGYLSPEDVQKKYGNYLSPEEAAKKDAKIEGYEKESLKVKLALEAGIPYELATKLSGDDEESIKKDAETMAKYLKGIRGPAPLGDTEPPLEDSKKTAMKKMLAGLRGE